MASAKVINTAAKAVIKVDSVCQHRMSTVLYKVPFKIRVTNITVPGYTPTDVPPIGLAIIGVNNYIL